MQSTLSKPIPTFNSGIIKIATGCFRNLPKYREEPDCSHFADKEPRAQAKEGGMYSKEIHEEAQNKNCTMSAAVVCGRVRQEPRVGAVDHRGP